MNSSKNIKRNGAWDYYVKMNLKKKRIFNDKESWRNVMVIFVEVISSAEGFSMDKVW